MQDYVIVPAEELAIARKLLRIVMSVDHDLSNLSAPYRLSVGTTDMVRQFMAQYPTRRINKETPR